MGDGNGQAALLKQSGTTYPRVVNARRSIRHAIDAIIMETAYEAIPSYDPGTSVVEAASSYLTTVNTDGILSLKFQDYYYPEHAAHGVTKISSVTLDLSDAHVYGFQELFRPGSDYRARLNAIIQQQIISQQIPLLQPYPGVGADEEYYLTQDSLVIYYQPYVYTPGAYGALEFKIPYAQIGDIIDPRGPIGRIIRPG